MLQLFVTALAKGMEKRNLFSFLLDFLLNEEKSFRQIFAERPATKSAAVCRFTSAIIF